MAALGAEAKEPGRVYLTGGASAVACGWRNSTADVDLKFEPEQDAVLRAIPAIKERLEINVELASPDHFIPALKRWRELSTLIEVEGQLSFYHYAFEGQALAKIERGHAKDLEDVREMLKRSLVSPEGLRLAFAEIEPDLYRYPAVNAAAFRKALEAFLAAL